MPATHYITIDKFCAESGYTPDAIRSKIKRGDWLPGKQFAMQQNKEQLKAAIDKIKFQRRIKNEHVN